MTRPLHPLLLLALLIPACAPRSCEDAADVFKSTPQYMVEIHYPKTSVRAMTCEAHQDIDAELESFTSHLPAMAPGPNLNYEFRGNSTLRDPRPGLESVELNIFEFARAAQPVAKDITINYAFDKQGWYKLDLPRLFKPGTDWRSLLLPYARAAALKLNSNASVVDKGLEDRDGQWSRFSMDPGALTLIFEPGQLGPAVTSRVRVPIAWAALHDKLDPRWFPTQGVK